MGDVLTQLREACATVAQRARSVRINQEVIPGYAASLPLGDQPSAEAADHLKDAPRDHLAAYWLTLDAINFGSGWFPALRKRAGKSGYHTIAEGVTQRFATKGPWSAGELQAVTPRTIAAVLGQDPANELMNLFARSLGDLARHVADDYGGRFEAVVDSAGNSAMGFVETLATWECFADVSTYDGLTVAFLKRAQIAAADLDRANVVRFEDLDRLTMFADNLVPHVLRLDGVLTLEQDLVGRIERQELIEHGSREEIEIRACALHAVELIAAQRPDANAAQIDQLLWLRGQQPRYKAIPRHRSRCTAY